MRRSKTKRFTYWQARFTPETYEKRLQQLLNSGFGNTKVGERLWPTDEEENYRYFINHQSKRSYFSCANFFGYEKGKIGQVIKEAFDKDQIDTIPHSLSSDEQYLEGKLYFVCFGNHVILSQDTHLKAKRLEHYLNEMFHKLCNDFPKNQQLMLERSISRKVRKQIKGVRKIHLSAPLKYKYQETSNQRQQQIKIFPFFPLGHAWEAVESFIGESLASKFNTDGFIDPKDIEVSLSLSWKRKKGEKISDQLDSLANTFRHVDDEIDFEVETNSGKLEREKLRLEESKSVAHINDMPDLADIFGKMIDWYRYLVEAEDI